MAQDNLTERMKRIFDMLMNCSEYLIFSHPLSSRQGAVTAKTRAEYILTDFRVI